MQSLHEGNSLLHLFFLLWQRAHEDRALAGTEAGTGALRAGVDAAGALCFSGSIAKRRKQEYMRSLGAREVETHSCPAMFAS